MYKIFRNKEELSSADDMKKFEKDLDKLGFKLPLQVRFLPKDIVETTDHKNRKKMRMPGQKTIDLSGGVHYSGGDPVICYANVRRDPIGNAPAQYDPSLYGVTKEITNISDVALAWYLVTSAPNVKGNLVDQNNKRPNQSITVMLYDELKEAKEKLRKANLRNQLEAIILIDASSDKAQIEAANKVAKFLFIGSPETLEPEILAIRIKAAIDKMSVHQLEDLIKKVQEDDQTGYRSLVHGCLDNGVIRLKPTKSGQVFIYINEDGSDGGNITEVLANSNTHEQCIDYLAREIAENRSLRQGLEKEYKKKLANKG